MGAIWVALFLMVSAMHIETRGYLYSYSTHSFVGNQKNVAGMDSEPLLVTMRIPGHYAKHGWKAHGSKAVQEFEVTHLGDDRDNDGPRYRIEMDPSGKVRIRHKKKCGAIYNGMLRIEKCSSIPNQVFAWIPEHLFSDFVEKLHNKAQRHHGKKRFRDSKHHRPKNIRKHKDGIASDFKDIKDAMEGIKKTLIETRGDGALNEKCDDHGGACITKGGRYGHLNDRIFNNYLDFFCKTNPINGYCRNSSKSKDNSKLCISKDVCKKSMPHSSEPFMERTGHDMDPILDQKFMDDITGILKSSGNCMDIYESPIYESKTKRPRVRGIFGRGDDSSEVSPAECWCKLECIRNPNNGMCYYKADSSGKLVPIMSDESCCSTKKSSVCNIGNKLDKYLCELTIKNDYSFFSKFLDQNYVCS